MGIVKDSSVFNEDMVTSIPSDVKIYGVRGNQGPNLTEFTILGNLPDIESLPTTLNNVYGDAYIVQNIMMVWDNDSWVPIGQVGPPGPDGLPGPEGPNSSNV